jgi:GH24 family phage-related lysozyme (muramidase)
MPVNRFGDANLNWVNVTKLDSDISKITEHIKKSLKGLDKSIFEVQAKMQAIRSMSKVSGDIHGNESADFFGKRIDEIAANIKRASVLQLKNNRTRLENLKNMAKETMGDSEQGAGVYKQYEVLVSKVDEELKNRKKLFFNFKDFMNRQGINTLSVVGALTAKSPIVGLGLKYILERRKASQEFDKKNERAGILDSIAYRDFLRKQREKIGKPVNDLKPPRKERGGDKDYERKRRQKPEQADKRKKRQEESEHEYEEKKRKKNDDNIIDAEFEDITPKYEVPRVVGLGEGKQVTEGKASKTPFAMGAVPETPPPPSRAPLLLGAGNFQNRNAKGQFAPGRMQGNYVPKQENVISHEASPIESLTKTLLDIKIINVKMRDDIIKFHKEDKTKTDEQLAAEEEKRIKDEQHQEELIKSIRVLNPDSKKGKELAKDKVGPAKTIIDKGVRTLVGGVKSLIGAGIKTLFGGGAAAGAAEGAAGAAGAEGAAAGAAGAGGAGALAMGAGAVTVGLGAGYVIAKSLEKVATFGATDKKLAGNLDEHQWGKLYAEALGNVGVKEDRPWWMPYGVWLRRVNKDFGTRFLKNKETAQEWKEWLLAKHPDIAKRTYAYDNDKDKFNELASLPNTAPLSQPHVEIPTSPKISNNAAGPIGAKDTAPSSGASMYVPPMASETPAVVSPASGNNPPVATPTTLTVPVVSQAAQMAPVLSMGKQMKMSDAGLKKLTDNEGFADKPYPDAGHMSIGFGHQIQAGENLTHLTRPEGMELLRKDLALTEKAVNSAVKVPITQGMFDSLVDFTYNTGKAGGPSLNRVAGILNSGKPDSYKLAGSKMREYNKSRDIKGNLSENTGLTARRKDEAMAFDNVAIPNSSPQSGRAILAANKDIEDKKAQNANSGGGGNTVVAPTNTQNNNTTVVAQQHDPRNTDNTFKDTRYRNSVRT